MRGATRAVQELKPRGRKFQSTPPVRGATWGDIEDGTVIEVFQSTPPVRGATGDLVFRYRDKDISIHAPRAGGDKLSLLKT